MRLLCGQQDAVSYANEREREKEMLQWRHSAVPLESNATIGMSFRAGRQHRDERILFFSPNFIYFMFYLVAELDRIYKAIVFVLTALVCLFVCWKKCTKIRPQAEWTAAVRVNILVRSFVRSSAIKVRHFHPEECCLRLLAFSILWECFAYLWHLHFINSSYSWVALIIFIAFFKSWTQLKNKRREKERKSE